MRKLKPLFLLLPFVFTVAKAQSFQPTVIASAGAFATSTSGSMTWTVGEVMTDTYSSSNNFFTQGFNQPDSTLPNAIGTINTSEFTVSCYPNPVIKNLSIVFSQNNGKYILAIYDMGGKKLNEQTITGSSTPIEIPFTQYREGVYMVTLINSETAQKFSFKVIKSN